MHTVTHWLKHHRQNHCDVEDILSACRTGAFSSTPFSQYPLLGHIQNQTAFVALSNTRKPVGYATWHADDQQTTITRQVAPFGDHMQLQTALERRLELSTVSFQSSSARKGQVAW